jgi:CrcB protein
MRLSPLLLVVLVGLAGACGALVRYIFGRFVAERIRSQFPLGTFLINVTGAFVIGILFTLTARKVMNPSVEVILATGFLGGYTTFSTMSWEAVQLARSGSITSSTLYLGGNGCIGLIAAVLGMVIGGWLSWDTRFQHDVAGWPSFAAVFWVQSLAICSARRFSPGSAKAGLMIS